MFYNNGLWLKECPWSPVWSGGFNNLLFVEVPGSLMSILMAKSHLHHCAGINIKPFTLPVSFFLSFFYTHMHTHNFIKLFLCIHSQIQIHTTPFISNKRTEAAGMHAHKLSMLLHFCTFLPQVYFSLEVITGRGSSIVIVCMCVCRQIVMCPTD